MGAARVTGITVGTILILAVGCYGPAMLVGPLPEATATALSVPDPESSVVSPVLPETGASALAVGDELRAAAGSAEALPMSGAARLVTVLVTNQRHPLESGPGPEMTITDEDYARFRERVDAGSPTIPFYPGDTWSQSAVIQSALLSGSTNHADALAVWAYGSIQNYLDAAASWATRHGLTSLRIADAAGLSLENTASAADLARIAALASQDPAIMAALDGPVDALAAQRGVRAVPRDSADTRVLYRGYRDNTGIVELFTTTVQRENESLGYSAAFLRSATWSTLGQEIAALRESAERGITRTPPIEPGSALVRLSAPWGDSVQGRAVEVPARIHWATEPITVTVRPDPVPSSVHKGKILGRATIQDPQHGEQVLPLIADASLDGPDILWRLTHPVEMISAWFPR